MKANLLHYRVWHGQFGSSARAIWPIARVALGGLFRRKLFWILYAAGLLLFFMFFFGTYLLAWAESQIPSTPITFGRLSADPDRLVRALRRALRILNGSQETFAYFFVYQGGVVMVVLTLAGSVLVGNDFTFGSMGFYLSKPIGRWHYLLGKCLAVGIVVNMLTTLPALLLFIQHGLDDWEYFVDPDYFHKDGGSGMAGWPLLLGILEFGLLLTVFLSMMLVATASWVRRTMPLVMVWTGLFLFLRLLANTLVDGLHYHENWRLLDLWNNLCLIGFAFLGHVSSSRSLQPSVGAAGLVLFGVSLVCLIYMNRRTRAVEIIP